MSVYVCQLSIISCLKISHADQWLHIVLFVCESKTFGEKDFAEKQNILHIHEQNIHNNIYFTHTVKLS